MLSWPFGPFWHRFVQNLPLTPYYKQIILLSLSWILFGVWSAEILLSFRSFNREFAIVWIIMLPNLMLMMISLEIVRLEIAILNCHSAHDIFSSLRITFAKLFQSIFLSRPSPPIHRSFYIISHPPLLRPIRCHRSPSSKLLQESRCCHAMNYCWLHRKIQFFNEKTLLSAIGAPLQPWRPILPSYHLSPQSLWGGNPEK